MRFLQFLTVALFAAATESLVGQPARLSNVNPPGAKAGGTVEITISGQDLGTVKELRFSHAGIRARAQESNRFTVNVSAETPPGIYEVRAVGKHGASNPRAFAVGVLNEFLEAKNSTDSPQRMALESTINGRTETNTVDYFRFEAKKDQRVLVRCDARAIDSKLEPVLTMIGSSGREVARSRSGGLLDYTLTADGELTVRLHDATYRGGTDFFYRLSVGTFPHIDYVMSMAGEGKTTFAVVGRNLPGSTSVETKVGPRLERMVLELSQTDAGLTKPLCAMPAQAALDLFEYRVRSEKGISQPIVIRFPTAPVRAEDEPNNTAAAARDITAPCEIAGEFNANGDRDWFRINANKGDVYWMEVFSHRLGWATDPFLLVQRVTTNGTTDVLELNDSEANFGGPEFNTSHRDPAGKFEAKESGPYLIQVRDLFTRSKQSRATYQLSIGKPAPAFRLVMLPGNALPAKKDAKDIGVTAATLRRGETLPVKVMAFRRDGFDGEIAVSLAESPPGLVTSQCRIESGKNSALLFLTATDEAAAAIERTTIRGRAIIGGSDVSEDAVSAAVVWGTADPANEAPFSRLTADPALSIIDEQVPVRVYPESNVVHSVTGKTAKINFLIDRRGSSVGGVKLKPFGLAALDSVPEADVDEKATNLVLQIDLREKKVPAGTHVFAVQVSPQPKAATDKSKKPRDPPPPFYSEPVVLKVSPSPPASTNSPAK